MDKKNKVMMSEYVSPSIEVQQLAVLNLLCGSNGVGINPFQEDPNEPLYI